MMNNRDKTIWTVLEIICLKTKQLNAEFVAGDTDF
jgi:hypothetical protein